MEGDGGDGVDGDECDGDECDLDDTNSRDGQASQAIEDLAAVGVDVAVVGGLVCSKTSVSTSKLETRETEQSRGPEDDLAGQQPISGDLQPQSPVPEHGTEAMNLLRQEAVQRLETVKNSSTPLPPSISVARALSLSPSIPLFSLRALSPTFSTRSAAGSPIPFTSPWNKVVKSEDTFSTRQSPNSKAQVRKAQERICTGRQILKKKTEIEEEQEYLAASEDEEEGFNPPEIIQNRNSRGSSRAKVKERVQRDSVSTKDEEVRSRNTSGPPEEDQDKNFMDHEERDVEARKESFKSEEDNDDECKHDSAKRDSEEEKGPCIGLQKDDDAGKQDKEDGAADQEECPNPSCRVAITRMRFPEAPGNSLIMIRSVYYM